MQKFLLKTKSKRSQFDKLFFEFIKITFEIPNKTFQSHAHKLQ